MCERRILTVHWIFFKENKNTNNSVFGPGNLLVALYLVNFYLIVSKIIKRTLWCCLVDVSQHDVRKWVIQREADRVVNK